nr:hypothetical protein Iba_chr12bCG14890 [Ipomoea batatas]GMD70554.1 hypothetical protein Iba_chr12eCG7440 [Ipomoea batatas]GMD72635.1 hypothetical protein Iba_chr12fCG10500 [Ipomoea batatas]GMD79593.1 hypothetical protein Iba_chr13dCG5430 [Ipomoea batatas]
MFCQNQPSSPSMLPMNSNSQQKIHKARFHFPVTEACSLLVLVYQGEAVLSLSMSYRHHKIASCIRSNFEHLSQSYRTEAIHWKEA